MSPKKKKKPPRPQPSNPVTVSVRRSQISLNVTFKMAFWAVLLLTIISAVASVFLATLENQTENVTALVETFSTTWKMGFGAFIGLIGGKTLP